MMESITNIYQLITPNVNIGKSPVSFLQKLFLSYAS